MSDHLLSELLSNRFSEKSNGESWIKYILILGGLAYSIVGSHNYLSLKAESDFLFFSRIVISIAMIMVGIGTFFSNFLKQHAYNCLIGVAYVVNFHILAIASYANFNITQTLGVFYTQIIAYALFRTRSSLLSFALFSFVISVIAVFVAEHTSISHFMLIQHFVSVSIFMTLIVYSKIRMQEKALLKGELFKTVFNQSADTMLIVNPKANTIVAANQKAIQFFELDSEEELLGKREASFRKNPITNEEKKQVDNSVITGFEWKIEQEYISKKGKTLWGNVLTKCLDINDYNFEVVRIADITEQKKTEAELRMALTRLSLIISNIPSAILVEDVSGKVVIVNEFFCSLFNLKGEPASLVGADMSDLAEKNKHIAVDEDYFAIRIKDILKRQEIVKNEEVFLKGGLVYERDYIPVFSNNSFVGQLWRYRDITEHKRNQSSIIESEAKYKTAQLKDQFLTNVSHEIRTPLNAILGFSNLLKSDSSLLEKQREYINGIRLNSKHLVSLINDILDISKLEEGKIPLDEVEFNIRTLLEMLYQSQLVLAQKKGVDLRLIISDKVPGYIVADKVKLNQILLNLISNAIKFTSKGYVEMAVTVHNVYLHKAELLFSVKDTGVGIPQDKLETIFEKFTQASNDISKKYGGTGLGLTIVKQFVNMMGGVVNVSSKPNEYTEFSVLLPVDIPEKVGLSADLSYSLESNIMGNCKILLIEDNHFNQVVCCDTIWEWNKDILIDIASDGKQAIECVNKNKYDLILLDIQIPEMDGYETAIYIRNQLESPQKDIPIIAMTAHAISQEFEKCKKAGMNDYIAKPFNPAVLFEKIKKQICKNSAHSGNSVHFLDQSTEIVNYEKIRTLANHKQDRIEKMIAIFLNETPSEINTLEISFSSQDFETLANVSHAMIPKYLYMGMPLLSDKLKIIQRLAIEQKDFTTISLLINEIRTKSEIAYKELQRFLAQTTK